MLSGAAFTPLLSLLLLWYSNYISVMFYGRTNFLARSGLLFFVQYLINTWRLCFTLAVLFVCLFVFSLLELL
jgi:hypothetical protein